MNTILMSIKPVYVEKIFNGTKQNDPRQNLLMSLKLALKKAICFW